MILSTLKEIAKYVGVGKTTIRKWHMAPDDPTLAFPLVPRHYGRGVGIAYTTDTVLITEWMARRAAQCAQLRRTMPASRRRSWLSPSIGKSKHALRERRPRQRLRRSTSANIVVNSDLTPIADDGDLIIDVSGE